MASIPQGSWVLVTGATGYVATHVIKVFLERGYKVRGTVRDLARASWLLTEIFPEYHTNGAFELVVVPTLADEHAFDEAIKGVSAVVHVASIVSFDSDPAKVIPQTVLGATALLEAALKEPSVREFVYTSSIVASALAVPGNDTVVGPDTYNEAAVKLAWTPPASGFVVYAASKTEAEKAVWKFVRERQPHFTVNSVGPATIIGAPMHKSHLTSEGAWLGHLYKGETERLGFSPAIWTVDVKDVALLHAAAVLDPDTKNARLQAWADNTDWNTILHMMRRRFPDDKFVDDLPGVGGKLSVTADFTEPLALLKKWAGQDGWAPLEQTVVENMEAIRGFEAK